MVKYLIAKIREYIFIILTATIFLSIFFSNSFSEENVFNIEDIKVEGIFDVNFSRNKYIDIAFKDSYKILMSKILLSSDFSKVNAVNLKQIKEMVSSFKILEESYINNEYKGTYKVFFNEIKIKKFLSQKNISFSQPKNIIAVFYPVFFINGEIQDSNNNFFYQKWNEIKIKNELINFILPIEDIDDIYKIKEAKDDIEKLNIQSIVKKYDTKNYVFALLENENNNLNIYLKTSFNKNKVTKNISYQNFDVNNKINLEKILKDLKIKVTDIWKKENIINLSAPLSLRVKVKNINPDNLDKLKNTFYKIDIINNYTLEEFNINYAFFKIYYYGNPKRLKTNLLKFGYELKNEQGRWAIYSE